MTVEKKKLAKKLTLNRETLRWLEDPALLEAAGAATVAGCPSHTFTCSVCRPCCP
ncbi:MAG TPA: hypothetical protein VFE33_26085 [Thermoanaerobaculia bacterium]|nr:hypothetical protein [Thermoanaerobaculia bacterium]